MSIGALPPVVADADLAGSIAAGAAELRLPLLPSQVHGFVDYIRLIERWNATYNLTAVRDPAEMVTHHLLDCLAAAAALLRRRPPSRLRRVLDVGSGAGLPGLVLAAVLPETQIVCVDSVGKKTAFVTQAAIALKARNAVALHARVQSLKGSSYDVIASRAFGSLAGFVDSTQALLADNGEWMAMKGRVPHDEIAALRGIGATVEPLAVPGLLSQRCLVWMTPEKE